MTFVKLREAEPMARRHAALVCLAAAAAGWTLALAGVYAACWLVGI